MSLTTRRCPQCLTSVLLDAEAKFCPRCGREVPSDAGSTEPIELKAGDLDVVVGGRLAFGYVANLYHCSIRGAGRDGVFKVARTATANKHLLRESRMLSSLHARDVTGKLAPFIPRVVGTLAYAAPPPAAPQQANVLAYHAGIESPDELYTLEEVAAAHAGGLDARDVAWIWRRLLTVLGLVHDRQAVHTAVTPDHVLIEPSDHKLVLIGWCGAVRAGERPVLRPLPYEDFRDGGDADSGASPVNDLRSASKSMSYLLGENADPAIKRHLERAAESTSANAWRLLDDFDRIIEALWGPRRFRTFAMPARSAGNA